MAREVIGDKQESEMVSTAMLCGSLWLHENELSHRVKSNAKGKLIEKLREGKLPWQIFYE